jgi:hypothetical protein
MTAFPGQGPGKKYQFVTRSGWTLKFWIFNVGMRLDSMPMEQTRPVARPANNVSAQAE